MSGYLDHVDRYRALADTFKDLTGCDLDGYVVVGVDGCGDVYYGADAPDSIAWCEALERRLTEGLLHLRRHKKRLGQRAAQ